LRNSSATIKQHGEEMREAAQEALGHGQTISHHSKTRLSWPIRVEAP
jgi:hypothetical protein